MNLKRLLGLDILSEEYAYATIPIPGYTRRSKIRRNAGCPPPAATARSAAACSSA